MNKLTKEEAEKKATYHKKRTEFYQNKVKEISKEKKKIGFKFY